MVNRCHWVREKARENMVESSKILTVSYGTFSCTLEGFDDSFATMKAIAEYFRDLAERDRYFGAEPPTPDAEMLTRIAEREIERRVEARMDDSGIVLRASEENAQEPTLASEVTALAPTTPAAPAMPPQPTPPVVTPFVQAEPSVDADTIEEDTATIENIEEAVTEQPVAVQPTAEETETETEVEASNQEDEDETESGLTFEDMSPAGFATVPSDTDTESVAAKLRRIRAVVGQETTDDTSAERSDGNQPFIASDDLTALDDEEVVETEELASDLSEETSAESEDHVASEEDVSEDVSDDVEAEVEAAEIEANDADLPTADVDPEADVAVEEVVEAAEADDVAEELVEEVAADDVAEELIEEVAEDETEEVPPSEALESVEAEADVETELEADVEEPEVVEPARQSIRARILRVARPLRPTPAETIAEDAETADEAVEVEADAADQDAPSVELDDVEGLISRVRSNASDAAAEDVETDTAEMNGSEFDTSEDVAEAVAEEAETEVEAAEATLSAEDEADLQEELAEVEREIEESKASNKSGRDILPENDDAAMSRILNRADEQLAEPESSRRRNAIAQLKAAVAATEAARQLGDSAKVDQPEAEFREDLDKVVRPRRASSLPKAEVRTERPRPAPLKLVAAQRIDAPEDAAQAPVQPRRVNATAAVDDSSNFAEFAEKMGATQLEDLLEAAAAYTAFVEGNEDFSRPQIMQKVQATSETGYSREDSLRSFGTLLREGRISKVRNGRFQINQQTRFKPEQKAG